MYKAVVIGGSAGSFQVITRILNSLPKNFPLPVLLSLHRLKHVRSGFVEALSIKSAIEVVEPSDKDTIKPGKAYLAPSNYHMYIELNKKIALSTEEPVNHSRPSIDLTFETAAQAYRDKIVGIILSGANRDGAYGLQKLKQLGGLAIVQDPNECQVKTMTEASLKMTQVDHIFTTQQIINFLQSLK
ncbi:MAG: chemotaxis protein CheB [Bacteroidetes bacterium GWC2_33_15]|nr:MAG: chemotaxis protein CheB [Bacteroidetes bacterium GWA2_33_15]OFX48986.1 MAG: chemotaxis protein CheB [Bacteroidetes bacterium GWC2_33_15]OFX64750.1 MAG: chemotaxis protein CheB [Bacteroidetes bacterium GWB2_32_14]OFX68452.1 MAG: chemotaxis protein CheB [Bacteroidetes bacterium GWD2_33_33]HAN19175.1 chemotaxis protein CheB [Bacteroidales bacterium]